MSMGVILCSSSWRTCAGIVEHREESGVDHRMQCLHAAVEDLRKTGDVGDLTCGDVVLLQERERAARRNDLDARVRPAPMQMG